MNLHAYGAAVRKAREVREWSQADLGSEAVIPSISTISQIESGKRRPTAAQALELAKALDLPISVQQLAGGTSIKDIEMAIRACDRIGVSGKRYLIESLHLWAEHDRGKCWPDDKLRSHASHGLIPEGVLDMQLEPESKVTHRQYSKIGMDPKA